MSSALLPSNCNYCGGPEGNNWKRSSPRIIYIIIKSKLNGSRFPIQFGSDKTVNRLYYIWYCSGVCSPFHEIVAAAIVVHWSVQTRKSAHTVCDIRKLVSRPWMRWFCMDYGAHCIDSIGVEGVVKNVWKSKPAPIKSVNICSLPLAPPDFTVLLWITQNRSNKMFALSIVTQSVCCLPFGASFSEQMSWIDLLIQRTTLAIARLALRLP